MGYNNSNDNKNSSGNNSSGQKIEKSYGISEQRASNNSVSKAVKSDVPGKNGGKK